MKKKVMAILMAAALCVGLLPTTILAEAGEYSADDAEDSAEETEVQAANIEISEDGTATIVLDDAGEEEELEEEAAETEEPEAEPEGEVEEAVEADEAVEAEEAEAVEETAEDEAEPEEVVYTGKDGSVSVKVTAPYGALPEDAELKVERFAKDSKEYKEAAEAIGLDEDDSNMAALDISFEADGEEVEPSEAVKVSIDASKILPEDADAGTLEVQHLKEGRAGQVRAEVVANVSPVTEGTIDESKATAEFEVESFSVFTVEWNDGTNTSIEVHIYSINGTSVDEELDEDSALIANNGTITIQDLVDHLESNADYVNEYTFRYAMVVYQVAQQPSGYEMTKIGSEGDSVTSISKSETTYTIYRGTTSSTISDPDSIVIRLYYSVPEVTIETSNAHESEVTFTTSNNYFNGNTEEATYTWTLSNDSEGTLTNNNDGTATFVWGENAQAGDKETVTVTMTVGDETASDTYTLTYGDQQVIITVYANGTTIGQANAHVALVDPETGETIATGTTDENGQVTLYAPEGSYTVGVTYVVQTSTMGGGSAARYTAEGTVDVNDNGGTTTVTLGTAITSGPGGDTNGTNGDAIDGVYYYEHIDVKVAVAETTESSATFSDLDAVYVYDKYGNLIYYSDDLNQNPGTTDYNVLFDINGSEDEHSIVVSSEDTIVIVYEIYEDGEYKTYTATYTSGGTYKIDDYYPYNSVNAYQLYNNLYGGTYASQEAFEAAWEAGEVTGAGYNEAGIPIGGQTYILIADYLCDTRTTSGQAGLDFVIDVLDAVFEEYDIQIAKTYNTPTTFTADDLGTFDFTLQEIEKVTASDDDDEGVWDTTGDNLLNTTTGSTESWTGENGVWTSIINLENVLTYEAEDGTNFYYYVLSEGDSSTSTAETQYVGIKITVSYSASTGQTEIVASYCALEATEDTVGVYNKVGTWTEMEMQEGTDEDGNPYNYYEVPFVNTYSTTGFELEKVDVGGNPLDGAAFTIATSDGTTLYFISGTDDDDNVVYTLSAEGVDGASTEITVTSGGPVIIQGIAAGTYTLSETTPPEGYIAVGDFTVTIADDGTVTVEGTNVSVEEGSDVVMVIDLAATSITVTKTWVDNNNAYTTRPESITVTITGSDGSTYTLTLSSENGWTAIQDNLPMTDSNGNNITYTVTEETVNGYTGNVVNNNDGTYTITNTLTGTTEISVEKEWDDSNNEYETRPDSITVTITGSDGSSYTMTLSDANDWSDSNSELPLYDSTGTQITYTIAEETVNGYTGNVVNNNDGTYTITNTLETVDVEGSKTWADDSNDKYGTRPESIIINILNDEETVTSVTVTEEDNWAWSVTGLPKYDSNGSEITYTVSENAVPGYTISVDGYNVTNTLETTKISGEKTWVGDTEDDRPDSITIYLYADGVQTGDTVVVTADDEWAWEFTDLPKYQSDGTTEIVYTIMEGETEEGHLGEYIPSYSENGLNVTNSIPEVSKYVSDPAYGEDVEEELDEDEADNNDTLEYEIKAEHVGNAHELVFHDLLDNHLDIETLEIESVTLYKDEEDEGTALEAGIDYTYTTDTCGGEDCGLDGCSFEIKILDDDLAGLGSDAYIVIIFDITLKEDVDQFDDAYVAETDNWANISFFSFFATPVEVETYTYGFDIFKYTGSDEPLADAEFILSKDGDDGTVYAQFERTDDTYLLTGWVDSEDEATTIISGSDGNAVVEGLHDGTFTLTETAAPEGYAIKQESTIIEISVDEDDPSAPTIKVNDAEVDDETARIENTPEDEEQIPEKGVDVNGNTAYGDDGEEISVGDTLTYEIKYFNYNGTTAKVTITDTLDKGLDFVSASDDGVYDEDTRTITWVIEDAAANSWGSVTFIAVVNDTALVENEIENTAEVQINDDPAQITNEVDNPAPETRDISGSKIWDDDDDKADARPDSITVNLYQNGELYESKTVTEADDWAWSWVDLPKYDENNEAYAYTINEDEVEYYTPSYESGSFDITNTFVGEEGAENPTSGPDQGGDNPKTADTSNLGTWLALLIAAMACMLVGFRMRKRS